MILKWHFWLLLISEACLCMNSHGDEYYGWNAKIYCQKCLPQTNFAVLLEFLETENMEWPRK